MITRREAHLESLIGREEAAIAADLEAACLRDLAHRPGCTCAARLLERAEEESRRAEAWWRADLDLAA